MKSLPGLVPDGERILTSDDVLRRESRAGQPDHRRRRGGRRRVRQLLPRHRDPGDPARVPAGDRPARGPRGQPAPRAELHAARDPGHDEGPLRPGRGQGRQEGRQARRSVRRVAPTEEIAAEAMLVATGRAANVEDIGLETTKVEVERGVIKVNGRMRTREPHIYAIGDIVGGLWLAHTAAHEGIVAAHTIAGDPDVHEIDYIKQPRATYCRPEIASIGLTEAAVPGARHRVSRSARCPFQAIAKALIGGEYEGFAKVIGDAEIGRHPRRPHRRAARDRPHRGGLARRSSSRRRPGRSAARPTPTRRCPRSSARRPWRSTAGRSTSDRSSTHGDGGRPMTASDPANAATPGDRLGADLGLTDDDLLAMYRHGRPRPGRRRADVDPQPGRADPVRHQRPGPRGRAGRGHLGAPAQGHDWIAPFYRSIAMCLTFGMSARDIMLAQYAKASDPSSGGRQMPGHYGDRRHNLLSVSSPVATQILHAVGIALAAKIRGTGQVALAAMGEGSSNQGDVHEALNFAAIHKLPFVFLVENNGYAISVPAARELSGPGRRHAGGRLRHPGRRRRRLGRARLLRGGPDGRRAGPRGRRPDAHRGQGHPADRPLVGRPADEVPLRGGAGRRKRPATRCRASATSSARPGVLTDAVEAALAAELAADRRGRDRLRRGASPTRTRRRRLRWVYAEDWPSETPAAVGLRATGEPADGPHDVHRGDPRHAGRGDAARRPSVIVLGEDVGKKGGVFLATDGLWAEFGDDRVIDTPLTESMIVGRLDRGGRQRAPAGRRDPVRRLHLPGLQPDRVRGGPDALPLEQRGRRADDDPGAVRRRRPRRALPLAVGRGVLHPRARASRSSSRRRRTTPGACSGARSATTTRSSSSSTRRCTARVRGDVPDGDFVVPLGRARVTHPGLAGDGHRLRADGPLRARGGRPGGGGGDQRRGRRPADAPAARQGDRPRPRSARPASAWSSTRTTASAATARRSRRSSPRRRSTTSTARSPGSPARTCPGSPTTTSSRTGSWSTRRRSPTGSASSPPTECALGGAGPAMAPGPADGARAPDRRSVRPDADPPVPVGATRGPTCRRCARSRV